MTTYGVSEPLRSLLRASLYSLDEDNGAKWAVYDDGIENPFANTKIMSPICRCKVFETHLSGTVCRHQDTLDSIRYHRMSPKVR
jgi:hypothetical protein